MILCLPFIILSFIIIFLLLSKSGMKIDISLVTKLITENVVVRNQLVSTVTMLLMLIFIGTGSTMIISEIGSDKGSKLMEVILTSVTANTYFWGKLVGIFIVCLMQLLSYGVAGLCGIKLYHLLSQGKEANLLFNTLINSITFWHIIFLVLGIIAYTLTASVVGSLITKKEDITNAANPILVVALAGIFIGLWIVGSVPSGPISIFSSYFPLFSPFVMPARFAQIELPTVNLIISSVFLIIYSIIVTIISMRVYRLNALNYTKKSFLKGILGKY